MGTVSSFLSLGRLVGCLAVSPIGSLPIVGVRSNCVGCLVAIRETAGLSMSMVVCLDGKVSIFSSKARRFSKVDSREIEGGSIRIAERRRISVALRSMAGSGSASDSTSDTGTGPWSASYIVEH